MAQTWERLLFAHWPVPRREIAPLIPPGLTLDTYDGAAWVAVTPFVLTNLRARGLPALPGLSEFPELNVRTYVVTAAGPGVFFFSLDAGSVMAVLGARVWYHLPYFRARFVVKTESGRTRYECRRAHPGAPAAELVADYAPIGPVTLSVLGSLEEWLTERYRLYAVDGRGGVHRAEIAHERWPLQPADAEIRRNTMAAACGVALPQSRPLLHFARRLDVQVWPPRAVTRPSRAASRR